MDASLDYAARVASRHAHLAPPASTASTSTRGRRPSPVSFEPVFSIPHSCQIHSFAAAPGSTHVYTGGSDGYIRKYALYSTLNGTANANGDASGNGQGGGGGGGGGEAGGTVNLTMKQGGHEKPPGTDLRQPVLSAYWENEEPGDWTDEVLNGIAATGEDKGERAAKVKWGTKTGPIGTQSAVYSLAVQREELWGLSGTSKGSINLFTLRHDEGQIRHVFQPVEPTAPATGGHSNKSPVSVLTLDRDEASFLSGGWDGRIFDWDLNTGQVKRSFLAHGARRQISSISYRPLAAGPDSSESSRYDVDMLKAESPLSDTSSSNGVAATLVQNGSNKGEPNGDGTGTGEGGDDDAEGEMDADADGEIDDAFLTGSTGGGSLTASTLSPLPYDDPAKKVPLVGDVAGDADTLSRDTFLSTSLDGLVLLWDKRVSEGKRGAVRRFAEFDNTWDEDDAARDGAGATKRKVPRNQGWSTSACWSADGSLVHVARRSSVLQTYDLRHSSPVHTHALPVSTGPISCVATLGDGGNKVMTASWDCVRTWDLDVARPVPTRGPARDERGDGTKRKRTFGGKGVEVVSGHYGGTVSALHLDPTGKWMFTTSGTRGWEGNSTENLVIHEILRGASE
ncbi:hypothetical protein JCM10212_005669 [Sporobolomyces blumeae]